MKYTASDSASFTGNAATSTCPNSTAIRTCTAKASAQSTFSARTALRSLTSFLQALVFLQRTEDRPGCPAKRRYRYGPKGAPVDTPDILVKDNDKIVVAAECKATKLTYLAQFSEDPFETAKKQYVQIAKGVFQLWRFFSHIRQGIVEEELAEEVYAVVFTLDAFMTMAHDAYEKLFAEANALADKDGNITAEDRKPITICPIYDLEAIFARATEDSFLASLKASCEQKYKGWQLGQVHRDSKAAKEFGPSRRYPFDLSTVLPWWNRFREGNEEAEAEAAGIPEE